MLILTQGATSENIILTLNEFKTLESPVYTFTAIHVVTKEVISFDLGTDLSAYKDRFNEFNINTSIKFLDASTGQYQYQIKQKADNVQVEVGKLTLNPSTEFAFDGYSPTTTYNGYNG